MGLVLAELPPSSPGCDRLPSLAPHRKKVISERSSKNQFQTEICVD